MAGYLRDHWAEENGPHWRPDSPLGEPACRVRIGRAASKLSALRKPAFNLIKTVTPPTPARVNSMRRRQDIATINPDGLAAILARFASGSLLRLPWTRPAGRALPFDFRALATIRKPPSPRTHVS